MSLAEKRAALIAEHQAMVKYDPAWQNTTLAERPVAFLYDGDVVVIGDCVGKVLDGLKAFLARSDEFEKRGKSELIYALALKKAAKLCAEPTPTEIRCPSQTWNSYLLGLNSVGVDVVLAEGEA